MVRSKFVRWGGRGNCFSCTKLNWYICGEVELEELLTSWPHNCRVIGERVGFRDNDSSQSHASSWSSNISSDILLCKHESESCKINQ